MIVLIIDENKNRIQSNLDNFKQNEPQKNTIIQDFELDKVCFFVVGSKQSIIVRTIVYYFIRS